MGRRTASRHWTLLTSIAFCGTAGNRQLLGIACLGGTSCPCSGVARHRGSLVSGHPSSNAAAHARAKYISICTDCSAGYSLAPSIPYRYGSLDRDQRQHPPYTWRESPSWVNRCVDSLPPRSDWRRMLSVWTGRTLVSDSSRRDGDVLAAKPNGGGTACRRPHASHDLYLNRLRRPSALLVGCRCLGSRPRVSAKDIRSRVCEFAR